MTRKQIETKARSLSVKSISRLRKEELIRAVQLAEGHNECFRKVYDCRQYDCCWRGECQ